MNKVKITAIFLSVLTLFLTIFFLFPRDLETIDVEMSDLGFHLNLNRLQVRGNTTMILKNNNYIPITLSDIDLHAILGGGIDVEVKDSYSTFHFPRRKKKRITLPFKIDLTFFDIFPIMRIIQKCPGDIDVDVFGSVHVKALFVNGHMDIDDISHMFPCTLF